MAQMRVWTGPPLTPSDPPVFLSYLREDSAEVDRICTALKEHGIRYWRDKYDILPGTRWQDAIRRAIQEGSYFVACFSRNYFERERTYMNEELVLAIEELRQRPVDKTWFIPVLLSDCEIPDRSIGGGETLRDIQYIALHRNWQVGIESLISIIKPKRQLITGHSRLGASWQEVGTGFGIFSENATGVDLCLFDEPDADREAVRIRMTEVTDHVWHIFLPDVGPGQSYGYRVYGAYDPENGHRFNASKVLLDPYAKAITGPIRWSPEMFGYAVGHPSGDLKRDYRDNAFDVPKCVVVSDAFAWGGDQHPHVPLNESVIYEVHVKGFSKLCPSIPEGIRGTYAALGSEFAIRYFKNLGVTAVQLMPVHHFVNDAMLEDKGLSNYWGYSSIGYFAPHAAYSSSGSTGGQVVEFKQMVKRLHASGIEVILDVNFNHTGEGNHLGPNLCFRGLENKVYYKLTPQNQRYYVNDTGAGNTLNSSHPRVMELILDSLRYWVLEMHVDGFRFGAVPELLSQVVYHDPIISQVKLIGDSAIGGEWISEIGSRARWVERNQRYRNDVRRYWKGDINMMGEFAYRITGSPDLYEYHGRRPYVSINFITAHDGFTLADLVSYNDKHNEANGEDNRDGDSNNNSWNCGEEGPTDDADINRLRRRQQRNFLATLVLSQGVPMINAGDEFSRSQHGNNNAYCQDNELTWFCWDWSDEAKQLFEYTRRLLDFRRKHPVFRRPKYFLGRRIRGTDVKDIMWFNANGSEMTEQDWVSGFAKCFGVLVSGSTIDVRDSKGEPVRDDTFLWLCNAHHEPLTFIMPGRKEVQWKTILDSTHEAGFVDEPDIIPAGEEVELTERSLCLLQLSSGNESLRARW